MPCAAFYAGSLELCAPARLDHIRLQRGDRTVDHFELGHQERRLTTSPDAGAAFNEATTAQAADCGDHHLLSQARFRGQLRIGLGDTA